MGKNLLKEADFNSSFGFTKMLKGQINGENDSWAIRWNMSAFLKNMVTLYPGKSYVQNIGFDSQGTHSRMTDVFNVNLNTEYILERIETNENLEARKNFELYNKYLDPKYSFVPSEEKYQYNSYHTFVIQINKRDSLKKYLQKNNIMTAIHYPIPIHLQPAATFLGYKKRSFVNTEMQAKRILTLPIHQHISKDEIKFICDKINYFYKKKL